MRNATPRRTGGQSWSPGTLARPGSGQPHARAFPGGPGRRRGSWSGEGGQPFSSVLWVLPDNIVPVVPSGNETVRRRAILEFESGHDGSPNSRDVFMDAQRGVVNDVGTPDFLHLVEVNV